eukprot:CAMPEP_0170555622 /NCGR_PEP_ID=MMETSP0211-20121228/13503_1 /TAXON_ID=311385 /ORGANISM="Pseudokeronopsis sp., Strain OXSARD2" /LENGTH=49 /DNA_ID= /DNA_START= /DNA_END= /DNA_ORIENTATION=
MVKYSILKPNFNKKHITCPMCWRVSQLPSGNLEVDLTYMGEIDKEIQDW